MDIRRLIDTGQNKLKLLTDKSRANLEYTKPFPGWRVPFWLSAPPPFL